MPGNHPLKCVCEGSYPISHFSWKDRRLTVNLSQNCKIISYGKDMKILNFLDKASKRTQMVI
jgi:hypothetical protein